jgi:hypothetical protein
LRTFLTAKKRDPLAIVPHREEAAAFTPLAAPEFKVS